MEHVLAIDAGTTGVTSILFNRELRPIARAYREFAQSFPTAGWVEHDATEILAAVDATVGELVALEEYDSVVAIGVTNQRETIFALERSTGRPLAPGIVWQDRRTEDRCRELREAGRLDLVRSTTGLLLDPYFSATKMEWLLREVDEVASANRRKDLVFVTVDALVVGHLAGPDSDAWVTDVTNASRTMLFDLERRAWSAELCQLFGVSESTLARVEPSVAEFATSRPERTGGRALPIRGVAGDQQAALFGQGGFRPGVLKATFGTGSFLLFPTFDERVQSDGGLLTTLAADVAQQSPRRLNLAEQTTRQIAEQARDEALPILAFDFATGSVIGGGHQMRNGEFRIHSRNVQQGLGLKIENRRILGGVCDLQHVLSTVGAAQVKVLIALAHECASRTTDAEEPFGDPLGFFDRKGRSLGFQHAHGLAIGCGRHDRGAP